MAPSARVVHGSCEFVGVNLPAGRHRARRPVTIFSTDDTVQVWDLATGQTIRAPFTGHAAAVNAVAAAQLNGRPVVGETVRPPDWPRAARQQHDV